VRPADLGVPDEPRVVGHPCAVREPGLEYLLHDVQRLLDLADPHDVPAVWCRSVDGRHIEVVRVRSRRYGWTAQSQGSPAARSHRPGHAERHAALEVEVGDALVLAMNTGFASISVRRSVHQAPAPSRSRSRIASMPPAGRSCATPPGLDERVVHRRAGDHLEQVEDISRIRRPAGRSWWHRAPCRTGRCRPGAR